MGVLVTNEDNFDSSSLFLFRNDPQECCEEKATYSLVRFSDTLYL